MTEPKSLLLVGKVRPERKRSLTGMAVAAQLPLVAIEESAEAIAWLDANDPGCVIVDAGASRLDKLIAKIRAKRQAVYVPVLSLVSAPDDLWIEQYFGWGGDDVVHVDAGSTLLERLRAVSREPPQCHPSRRVLIGDPDKARTEVIGRVFGLAGFDVKSAIDRKSLEFYVTQYDPPVVVVNSILGELPELIARTRQNRSKATWIIMAARRELEAQQAALGAVERCAVMGAQVNPWQILYRSNELGRGNGVERRSEPRRPFGSFVLFRAAGSDDDDVGVAHNLCSHGMFIRTFAPALSKDVWLEWRVPQDKTRVRLEGRVVWRQASLSDPQRAASPLGFGVEFCDYLGSARKHLECALEVLDGGIRKGPASNPDAIAVAPAVHASSASPEAAALGASTGRASATRPSTRPPAAAAKAATPKSVATVQTLAKSRPSTAPKAVAAVKPTSNVGLAAAKPTPGAKSDAPGKPQEAGKHAGRLAPKSPIPNVAVPPRPAGAPPVLASSPRPNRGIGAAAGDPDAEIQVRRFETLRGGIAVDDRAENMDPDADRGPSEESPNSSEPTEILANPQALFGAGEEQKHPAYHASDDAPTVVTNTTGARMEGVPELGDADDEEPQSVRAAETFFGAEEQVTKQWHAEAAGDDRQADVDFEPLLPRRRTGRVVIVTGFVLVVAALAGVGLWLRASGAGQVKRLTHSPSAVPSSAASGLVPIDLAAASATSAQDAAADSAAPESSGSPAQETIAWAKIDDGSPLEGYPRVEDLQRGGGHLLADRYGYLVVRFPEAAFVFSENLAIGAANWKVATTCGEKTLRIGVGDRPIIWLSEEARVNVVCRETTRVVFRRLEGVVVPPGVTRPIAPGSAPRRKGSAKSSDTETSGEEGPSDSGKKKSTQPAATTAFPADPPQRERGIIDTRE